MPRSSQVPQLPVASGLGNLTSFALAVSSFLGGGCCLFLAQSTSSFAGTGLSHFDLAWKQVDLKPKTESQKKQENM